MASVISHALAVPSLRLHKRIIKARLRRLLAVLCARQVVKVWCSCRSVLLLVVRIVHIEVQIHVYIDRVKVVTVSVIGRILDSTILL